MTSMVDEAHIPGIRALGIVISGPSVSGKTTLSSLLSERYSKKVYSVGRLWREKWKLLYPNGEVPFHAFWSSLSIEEQRGVHKGLKSLVEEQGYILDTRFPSVYDRTKCITLFITASIDVRAERARSRPEFSAMQLDEIKNVLRSIEEEEVRVGMELFNVDYRDPKLYDMIIDTGSTGPEEELSMVAELIGRRIGQKG